MPERELRSAVKALRQERGLSQQALAAEAGLSRQSLHALESGLSAPATSVALKLARALGARVEDLFWLEESAQLEAELAPPLGGPAPPPRRVSLAKVGARWIAHALPAGAASGALVAADGLVAPRVKVSGGRVRIQLLRDAQALSQQLFAVGCDPALGLLAARAAQLRGGPRAVWLHAPSQAALDALAQGHAHLAGAHLFDEAEQEFNVPHVRRRFAGRRVRLYNLARWEEGFVVARGNPLRIRSAADLPDPGVRLVDREPGSGARSLLERLLRAQKL